MRTIRSADSKNGRNGSDSPFELRAGTGGFFFSFLNAVQWRVADVYSVGLLTEWIWGDSLSAAGEHEGWFGFSKGR